MPPVPESDPRIDKYLARVRAALRGIPERETQDIVSELRSHISEIAGGDGSRMDEALKSLGDPVDLAKTYRAESQMVQAECSGSPLVILQGLRHASRSTIGRVSATALYFFGYISMGTLWIEAFDKLFAPSRIGLWYTPGNLRSLTWVTGDGRAPVGARELLGWWLVPIALAGGWIVKVVADRIAQWWIRRYRRSKSTADA